MSEGPPARIGDALRALFMPWKEPPRSPAVTSGSVYANSFLARFVGERRALPDATEASDAAALAGWYRPDRRVFTTAESIADFVYLGAGILRVKRDPAGLEIGGAKWRSAGNGVFILDAPTRNRIVIRHDPRVDAPVLVPDLGIYTFTRIAWYQHPRLHFYMFVAALLACLGGLAMLSRRGTAVSPAGRLAAWVTTGAGWALPLIAFAGQASDASMLARLYAGHTERLSAFVVVANVMLIAALIALWSAARPSGAPHARRGLGIIGLAGLVIAGVLYGYNVIGWQVPG